MSRSPRGRLAGALASALLLAACGDDEPAGPPTTGITVLFIGNSLTSGNDLPGTLREMARAAGDTVHTGEVLVDNTAVIDHAYGQTGAMSVVDRGGWDFVVLQQGPTSLRICRDTLILAAKLFDLHVRPRGGVTALFMSWPMSHRLAYFDAVRDSYRAATRGVDGRFFPVGEAWREAWRRDPSLPLYAGDGYHPSRLGTLLAAYVIYEQVTGRDARAIPLDLRVGGVPVAAPTATLRLLMDVAHDTNLRYAPPDGLGHPDDDVIVDVAPANQRC